MPPFIQGLLDVAIPVVIFTCTTVNLYLWDNMRNH